MRGAAGIVWLCAFVALGASLVGSAPRAHAEAQGSGSLTATERRALDEGELIMRRVERRRGAARLLGGTSWQVIEAPPGTVWRALLDTSSYRHTLPRVDHARLLERKKRRRVVYIEHRAGLLRASYALKLRLDAEARQIRFELDDSHPSSVEDAWGFYRVLPYGKGRSLLVYGIMADIGEGLLAGLVRSTVHEWMLKVPMLFEKHIEGRGKKLYAKGS